MHELNNFFYPKSIAVIGASNSSGTIGFVELENLLKGSFTGKIFAVNPNHEQIQGIKSHKSVLEIKDEIDLAVVVVPAKAVPLVLEQCIEKKVKAVQIISAGFAEVGNTELTEQVQKIMNKGIKQGTRFLGPNILGTLYTKTGVDTIFNPPYRSPRPKLGGISFISQSGALGAAIIDWASVKNYGINKFISYGNAMDINEADLLEFLGQDKETKVIVMYIEGVKNGRKFFETAKKVAKKKPVVLIKGGVTEEASKATQSHTGSLAGSTQVFEALYKQTGIIKAETLNEVFEFAKIFGLEPKPKGEKVQIITNGGGLGVLSTDAVILNKLKLSMPSKKTVEKVAKISPQYAVLKNPMDLVGDADDERYRVAIEACMEDENIDSIILVMLFQVPNLSEKVDEIVFQLLKERKKPVAILSMGGTFSQKHKKKLTELGMSTFSSPFMAAKALKALTEFALRK